MHAKSNLCSGYVSSVWFRRLVAGLTSILFVKTFATDF